MQYRQISTRGLQIICPAGVEGLLYPMSQDIDVQVQDEGRFCFALGYDAGA
jgi:hypothetical protein